MKSFRHAAGELIRSHVGINLLKSVFGESSRQSEPRVRTLAFATKTHCTRPHGIVLSIYGNQSTSRGIMAWQIPLSSFTLDSGTRLSLQPGDFPRGCLAFVQASHDRQSYLDRTGLSSILAGNAAVPDSMVPGLHSSLQSITESICAYMCNLAGWEIKGQSLARVI